MESEQEMPDGVPGVVVYCKQGAERLFGDFMRSGTYGVWIRTKPDKVLLIPWWNITFIEFPLEVE